MKQFLLVSLTLVPVLLGVWAASDRKARRGLFKLLVSYGLFVVTYAALVLFFH